MTKTEKRIQICLYMLRNEDCKQEFSCHGCPLTTDADMHCNLDMRRERAIAYLSLYYSKEDLVEVLI